MGVLILSCLTSGLIIHDVAAYWQGVLKGAVIILGVAIDVLFNDRS
jgi:ribose/xylose/arabinose/galactoside ABC-type transport system permease subunit